MPRLSGCIPIVVTPFDANLQIDEAGLRRQVDYLIEHGVHGPHQPSPAKATNSMMPNAIASPGSCSNRLAAACRL
ncbi:MAG: hypothetical protein IPK16_03760 [Anaerolineales bacterium]|nr:hypothetical protein [Anaerolineales bacterium]